jgi:hypothetical protein
MAKVLTSITVDAPTGAITPAVDDTFAFTGTPGFTGSGGVQRYDFKWEVDDGGGYVTIGAAGTGLITADTNPLVNANSQTANSITVTCDEAGSYTIRMVGAPTTGGSYTVVSDTRDVTVSAAAITGDLAAIDGADTAAASGDVLVQGTMAATDAADTAAVAGDVLVQGDLTATDGADTFAATGTVGAATITGDLAVTDGADTAALTGDVLVQGALAATDGADVVSFAGKVVVQGDFSVFDGADDCSVLGKVLISGTLAAVDGADTALMQQLIVARAMDDMLALQLQL